MLYNYFMGYSYSIKGYIALFMGFKVIYGRISADYGLY
ncbi:hypothetical protein SAMN05518871_105311 [Psychrobacillus sp. OK028]|nr:hypothetical protein SAMN05518871_105311 [Psychrobacillus sp. OK028]